MSEWDLRLIIFAQITLSRIINLIVQQCTYRPPFFRPCLFVITVTQTAIWLSMRCCAMVVLSFCHFSLVFVFLFVQMLTIVCPILVKMAAFVWMGLVCTTVTARSAIVERTAEQGRLYIVLRLIYWSDINWLPDMLFIYLKSEHALHNNHHTHSYSSRKRTKEKQKPTKKTLTSSGNYSDYSVWSSLSTLPLQAWTIQAFCSPSSLRNTKTHTVNEISDGSKLFISNYWH